VRTTLDRFPIPAAYACRTWPDDDDDDDHGSGCYCFKPVCVHKSLSTVPLYMIIKYNTRPCRYIVCITRDVGNLPIAYNLYI